MLTARADTEGAHDEVTNHCEYSGDSTHTLAKRIATGRHEIKADKPSDRVRQVRVRQSTRTFPCCSNRSS